MASITLTIPDNLVNRVLDGFSFQNHYKDKVTNPETLDEYTSRTGSADGYESEIDNPETKVQFLKRKLLEYVKLSVKAAEITMAVESAKDAADTSVENEIQLS